MGTILARRTLLDYSLQFHIFTAPKNLNGLTISLEILSCAVLGLCFFLSCLGSA